MPTRKYIEYWLQLQSAGLYNDRRVYPILEVRLDNNIQEQNPAENLQLGVEPIVHVSGAIDEALNYPTVGIWWCTRRATPTQPAPCSGET